MNKVATASFAAGVSSLMLPCELSILIPEASRLSSIDLQSAASQAFPYPPREGIDGADAGVTNHGHSKLVNLLPCQGPETIALK